MLRIDALFIIFLIIVINTKGNTVFAQNIPMLKCTAPIIQNVSISFPVGVKFSTYQQGGEAKFKWILPAYSNQVECEKVSQAAGGPAYSWVTPVLSESEINPGFYKLTDDLDINISFIANGQEKEMPLEDISTGDFRPLRVDKDHYRGYFPFLKPGYVTLKLRREIIGGAIFFPANKLIAPLDVGSHFFQILIVDRMHMLNFVTEQEIIPVPSRCFINEGNLIDINLGDINSDWLAAESDKKVIVNTPLNIRCDGPLDSQDFSAVITLLGDQASFTYDGYQLLKSDKNNVGILLKVSGETMQPWKGVDFMMHQGGTRLMLSTMPLKKAENSEPITGTFTANATLVLSLP